MKGDNVPAPVGEESYGRDRLQLTETLRDTTNRENANDQGLSLSRRGGSKVALQPGLSLVALPKITNSNWTVSGTGKSDNDIPGKWFLTPDEEEKKQKKTCRTREPDVRSSTRSPNKVSNGTGVGLTRKHDNGFKDGVDYANTYIEMSKYLRLKKKFDDTQERLTNCTDVINKWYMMADNCQQNYSNFQREGMPLNETVTFNIERNEKRDMETLDMWKGKAMEYKAKYNTACKQLKTFKSEYDQAKRIEGEVNNWIVKAKDYRMKYRDLSKEYDNLLIRFKEVCKKET